jgi:hypothetical protein
MKWQLMALLAIGSAAGAAEAADWVAAEAEVEWRHEPRETIIVGDSVWRCDGAVCRGRVIDSPLLAHRACRAIARFTNGVTRFSTATAAFGVAQLERCNGKR